MLAFERGVIAALSTGVDPAPAVVSYVDGALHAMPQHLRAAVAVESVALGVWSRLAGDSSGSTSKARLDRWEASPIGPLRQYVRLFRSLVLFAEQELVAPTSSA